MSLLVSTKWEFIRFSEFSQAILAFSITSIKFFCIGGEKDVHSLDTLV